MGRKSIIEICRICGSQARRVNYHSKAKGRTYYYYKYIHSNGEVHYFRINPEKENTDQIHQNRRSALDLIEEIINGRVKKNGLRFSEIKTLLRDVYGETFSSATVYRSIDRLVKLNLIERDVHNGIVVYRKKLNENPVRNTKATRMSIGLVLSEEIAYVTIFTRVKNSGLGLMTGFNISLPSAGTGDIKQLSIKAYDDIGPTTIRKENILFSAPDQTVVMIPFNQPLRQYGEKSLFISFNSELKDNPFKMVLTSEIEFLKVSCKISRKEEDLKIERLLLDGLKRIGPPLTRRTATDPNYVILETEFEGLSRGDTILISRSPQ